MEELGEPENIRLLVRVLRLLRNWNQEEFAVAAGVDVSTISHYETGRTVPSRKILERLAEAVGLPILFVESSLLPALSAARMVSEPFRGEDFKNQDPAGVELGRSLASAGRSLLATFFLQLDSVDRKERERIWSLLPEREGR